MGICGLPIVRIMGNKVDQHGGSGKNKSHSIPLRKLLILTFASNWAAFEIASCWPVTAKVAAAMMWLSVNWRLWNLSPFSYFWNIWCFLLLYVFFSFIFFFNFLFILCFFIFFLWTSVPNLLHQYLSSTPALFSTGHVYAC